MGLNTTDDSREGIAQYLRRNPNTCFDDYRKLERELDLIYFAYDGLKIQL